MPRSIPDVSRLLTLLVALLVWGGTAAGSATYLFLHDQRDVVLATHNAQVRPTFDRHAVLLTGPVLPDLRLPASDLVGVDIQFGKTEVESVEQLMDRYGFIASHPDGQIEKVRSVVREMAVDAALRGALIGLLPLLLWWLVGADRRRVLGGRVASRSGIAVVLALAVGTLAWWRPWAAQEQVAVSEDTWVPLSEYLGIDTPPGLGEVEVRQGVLAGQTRRLITSALSTYDTSKVFYDRAREQAGRLDLRAPEAGEEVALFVSDRHDNIGMDPVARAIADRAGATAVFDGGDDTSTGQPWEAFSLDSVSKAYDDLDRWAVAGNHDHGGWVSDYLADRGWHVLDGTVVDGPGDSTLIGVDDPRSSGLGNWRDESGPAFDDVAGELADAACAEDEPVGTVLVHDIDLGREALQRGCVRLVIGGHTHVVKGPTPVVADNATVGYEFTTGTAGGAAYAIATGSKPRRPAVVSLITYRDGLPVGVQVVTLQTDGSWQVDDWIELAWPGQPVTPSSADTPDAPAPSSPSSSSSSLVLLLVLVLVLVLGRVVHAGSLTPEPERPAGRPLHDGGGVRLRAGPVAPRRQR